MSHTIKVQNEVQEYRTIHHFEHLVKNNKLNINRIKSNIIFLVHYQPCLVLLVKNMMDNQWAHSKLIRMGYTIYCSHCWCFCKCSISYIILSYHIITYVIPCHIDRIITVTYSDESTLMNCDYSVQLASLKKVNNHKLYINVSIGLLYSILVLFWWSTRSRYS